MDALVGEAEWGSDGAHSGGGRGALVVWGIGRVGVALPEAGDEPA